ncbi:MAG: patatin-like phospholipase family protein, partial [Candidatus Dormibacteraceae bacterium]
MTEGRALVLGGGGITGIAWELGLLAGLAEKGVQVMSPDLVVGTSAGSVAGAKLLSGVSLEDVYAEQLVDATGEAATRMGTGALARFVIASLWPGDARRGRAYLGRAALAARPEPDTEFRVVIEALVKPSTWPERRFLIVAVDA